MEETVYHSTAESTAVWGWGQPATLRVTNGHDAPRAAYPFSSNTICFDLAAEALERTQADNRELVSVVSPPDSLRVPEGSRETKAIALVDRWLSDDSGYDECVWPDVARSLDENRLSDRPRLGSR